MCVCVCVRRCVCVCARGEGVARSVALAHRGVRGGVHVIAEECACALGDARAREGTRAREKVTVRAEGCACGTGD